MLGWRSIPRPAALTGALLIASALGSPLRGQTLPQGLPGGYTLADVDGHALPYAPTEPGRPAFAPALEILASSLILKPDGHFLMAMAYRTREGGGKEVIFTMPFTGTIGRDSSNLVMRWDGAGLTPATWEADRFTFTNEGQTFTYRRQSPGGPGRS